MFNHISVRNGDDGKIRPPAVRTQDFLLCPASDGAVDAGFFGKAAADECDTAIGLAPVTGPWVTAGEVRHAVLCMPLLQAIATACAGKRVFVGFIRVFCAQLGICGPTIPWGAIA